MVRRKEMLIILLAQITITLVLTSAKPHAGFAQLGKGASTMIEQRFIRP